MRITLLAISLHGGGRSACAQFTTATPTSPPPASYAAPEVSPAPPTILPAMPVGRAESAVPASATNSAVEPLPNPGPGIAAPAASPASDPAANRAWYEGFEGPQTSWQAAGGDVRYRVEFQQRVSGEAHTGKGCEKITLRAENGSSIYMCQDVGEAMVIDELLPTLWIRSDRSGLQAFAEVVLPHTRDPRSGRPVSTLVAGSSYSDIGRWQQLRVDDLPRRLSRQVRVLRAQMGPDVDEREAYVIRLVLNVYGGPGVTNVWIDDLDLGGYVPHSATQSAARAAAADRTSVPAGNAAFRPEGVAETAARGPRRESLRVEFSGSVLVADGRPIFPRLVRYRGEPLEFLARLGFNGVWMDAPATPEVLTEAERLKLWIVCPPPRPLQDDLPPGAVSTADEIGPQYNRVLAWNLGEGLYADQFEATRRWAEQVRATSRRCSRPLIGRAEADLHKYSRPLDLLLFGREPLGTSLELSDYGIWVRSRPLLARPGTPAWTMVQTQWSPTLLEQLHAVDPARQPPQTVSLEQMRLLVYTAIASGSRGLLFDSFAALHATDAETQRRAMTLELLNLELGMLETWLATGIPVTTLGGTNPEITGTVLRLGRSRLLLPMWLAPGAQLVPGQAAGNHVVVIAPGTPDGGSAYELLPGGLRPARHSRELGGLHITLEEFGLVMPILWAQDPAVIAEMSRLAVSAGPRMAELQRQVAAGQLQAYEQVVAAMPARTTPPKQTQEWLGIARQGMQRCDQELQARDYSTAYLEANRSTRALRLLERAWWEGALNKAPSAVFSPAAVSFATLPWHSLLLERVRGAQPGPNLLPAGDFEDLATMLRLGWQQYQNHVEGVRSRAELVAGAAHHGRFGLQLSVWADDPKNPPAMVESPPLWVNSPAVAVEAGDLVSIRGWVLLPGPLTSTVDGLTIFDSFSGEPLAERICRTSGWREFTLYRMAPRSGTMQVTFALCGLGTACLDDVSIQVLRPAAQQGIGQWLQRGLFQR